LPERRMGVCTRAAGKRPAQAHPTPPLHTHTQDFYEDVFEELAKYGELENLNVCDNLADHLVGNVYAKFRDEDDAARALTALQARRFGEGGGGRVAVGRAAAGAGAAAGWRAGEFRRAHSRAARRRGRRRRDLRRGTAPRRPKALPAACCGPLEPGGAPPNAPLHPPGPLLRGPPRRRRVLAGDGLPRGHVPPVRGEHVQPRGLLQLHAHQAHRQARVLRGCCAWFAARASRAYA
jgi:hypothetical protein